MKRNTNNFWLSCTLASGLLLLQASCGSPANTTNQASASSGSAVLSNPAVSGPAKPLAFSDSTRIGSLMGYLASDELKGRDTGSEGIEAAAGFIEDQFREFGIKPYFSSYRDTLRNTKEIAYNIVGLIEGIDPVLKNDYVILGAHYDHIGIVPLKNGDGIANGANDNASGTSTVLELARFLSGQGPPKRSIIIALFSAEERGLLGSKHLAEKLLENGLSLYTMLNFEMTGVPLRGKDYQLYITGYDKSNLAEVSNRYAGGKLVGYLPTASEYNLFQRSDNYSFYKVFKVPSHTFSTFDFTNFNYYHQPGDENSEMDFVHMAEMVNKLIPVISGIASAPENELTAN
ncbi:M28 family metallopeptidase [Robiginitalea sp. IMCC43444]|uniref:M28 family metallopeptidase n=1 Tax=Robiginitalea sp. IMCC43444 TaxID=3459121 RepID=UPI004041C931